MNAPRPQLLVLAIVIGFGILGYTQLETLSLIAEVAEERTMRADSLMALAGAQAKSMEEIILLESYVADLEERLTGQKSDLQTQLSDERSKREALEREQKAAIKLRDAEIAQLELSIEGLSTAELSSIISSWQPRVVRVSCDFGSFSQNGSGLLFKESLGGIEISSVLTNKHVILSSSGANPRNCQTTLPTGEKFTSFTDNDDITVSVGDFDFGVMHIRSVSSALSAVIDVPLRVCGGKAETGDEILILGYPAIGSREDITATEGIVSGRDGNFYITSAKVEQGNSGGVVVHVKDNCYLGIPTFVQTGNLESLARILDVGVLGIE